MDKTAAKTKNAVRLRLPATVAGWLPTRSWLDVRVGTPPWIEVARRRVPVEIHPLPSSMTDDQVAAALPLFSAKAQARMNVVTSPFLRRGVRDLLEERGVAYADSQGHIHLVWDGVLLHIDAPTPRSLRQRPVEGLGPSGVRAVQALLQAPGDEPIQLSRLAAQVGLSLSQTHTVLDRLEAVGLLRSSGKGPSRRRTVIDRTQLLAWLAAQPTARRREPRLDVAVYARRPEDLWHQVSKALDKAGTAHALTGAAGCVAYGVAPTAVPLSTVRITPGVALEAAAHLLGAEVTDRGPNLRLLRDTGEVGCIGAERRDGVFVAPPIRVYLDTLSDKRGEDLAQQFREVVLGY